MKKQIVFSSLVLIMFVVLNSRGFAQTPNPVLITWQANNFYPADFTGKAMPNFGTPVTVSAEVVQNNKLLDLSQANFLWYVDESLVNRGTGLKTITFTDSKGAGDYHFVRVAIQSNNNSFENSLRIYSQGPIVAIESPVPNQAVPNGSQVLLRAVPYFFNVASLSDLNFSWLINGQEKDTSSDNQLLLTLSMPQGGGLVNLQVAAQNQQSLLEVASDKINLTIY